MDKPQWPGRLESSEALGKSMINIANAQKRVGVSRRTIYNWLIGGKLRYTRTAGGQIRIDAESLYGGGDS